jgi:hypothetical protein
VKKIGRRAPKKGQSVFVVTARHRSRIAGQIMSEIVLVSRGLLQALAAMREVLTLDYDIRDVVCGISLELLKTGILYRANHQIVQRGELPLNTIVHVGWCNGFHMEFASVATRRLGLDSDQLAAEQVFWASQK